MMYGFIYPRRGDKRIIVHTFPTHNGQEWRMNSHERRTLCGHFVPAGWRWRWNLRDERPAQPLPYPLVACVRCDRMRIVMEMAS